MNTPRVRYRVHALQRMFQRGISVRDILHVLERGNTIEDYPDDVPYPSRLVLGFKSSRPIHIVAADNQEEQEVIVITVYEPDPTRWEPGFEKRKLT